MAQNIHLLMFAEKKTFLLTNKLAVKTSQLRLGKSMELIGIITSQSGSEKFAYFHRAQSSSVA